MNRAFYPKALSIFVGFSITLLFVACGEEPPEETEPVVLLECGAGTVLQDGYCVVDDFSCPEGQVPTPAGPCSEPQIYCGSGSHYDAERQECVSSADVRCGPGTVEVSGRCVVEDAATCGAGTVLFDGFCVLSEDVCGDGTELTGINCNLTEDVCTAHSEFDFGTNKCVDSNAIDCGENTVEISERCIPFHTYADELAESADIDFSDSSTIEVGSQPGDEFIFTGRLTSSSNLFHVYNLQGIEGQWVEFTIYSRGLPSPGFRVRQVFGPWQRRALPGYSNLPSRTMVFPASEAFDLIVETTVSGLPGGPFGDESWQYVGVVTVIEPPQPQVWDLYEEPVEGELKDATANFLEVNFAEDVHTLLVPEAVGVDATNTFVELWSTPTTFVERFPLNQQVAISIDSEDFDSSVYLHVDSREFTGPRTSYTLQAVETSTLAPNELYHEEVEAEAGQVIFISHRSTDASTLTARVFLDDQKLYLNESVLANNRSSYTATATRHEFFYAPEDGTYTVIFENSTNGDITGFFPNSWADNVPFFPIDSEESSSFSQNLSAEGVERGDWKFILFETAGAARLTGTVEAGSGRPDVSIYDVHGERIDNFTSTGSLQEVDFNVWTGGAYFMAIRPFNTLSGGLQLEFDTMPLEALPPSETVSIEVSAETFDVMTGSAAFFDGGAPDLRLFNPTGVLIFEELEMGGHRDILELIPGSGTYTLEMTNNSDDPTLGFQLTAQATTPFEILNLSGSFAEFFDRPLALAEGDREMVVLRSNDDLIFRVVANMSEDEEASIQVRDLDTGKVIVSGEASETIDLTSAAINAGNFVVEFEALTDIEFGYDIEVIGSEISLVSGSREYDDPVYLENTGDLTGGHLSPINLSGCSQVSEIQLVLNFDSMWRGWVNIFLHSPSLAEPIHIYQPESFGTTDLLIFPENMNTTDSLDDVIGLTGDGEWAVEMTSTTNTFDSYFVGWTIELICAL